MCPGDPSVSSSRLLDSIHLPAPAEVLSHLVDVHCHPTDSPISHDVMSTLPIRICAMATRSTDQSLVRDLAVAYPDNVIPCFGYHPWFSHWIAVKPFASKEEHYRNLFLAEPSPKPQTSEAFENLLPFLPEPTLLSDVLAGLRENLIAFPNAMLGEVGLDRACRIPCASPSPPPYAQHEKPRQLSPFTIPLEHQLAILEAQIDLAVELKRNVSFHSVKSQQATVELLDKLKAKHGDAWYAISVDMHSCGLSAQTWKDIERRHNNVYLSLSTVINSRSPAHRELIRVCSPDRLMLESDYNDAAYVASQTCDMLSTVAEVKGWQIEQSWEDNCPEAEWGVVRRLEHNWERFARGGHAPTRKKDRRKLLLEDWESDDESSHRLPGNTHLLTGSHNQ
ncbi:hypothetical protein PHLGIDRAFT_100014 [Phlebiopsis gigantea 11061_1 CR5-6]|uniref:TatD DNase family Scn1 n=1 Tax=Phlebiopsis gigantea (strain 11061_1 CR5-6) TaxID=745531 RepID=A0A0C3PTZ6_PHLG1|nr:hypothetical protein PHLGIDRAFT_100014 [Phlebiopsis gigantea 11061_1 CR5-6]